MQSARTLLVVMIAHRHCRDPLARGTREGAAGGQQDRATANLREMIGIERSAACDQIGLANGRTVPGARLRTLSQWCWRVVSAGDGWPHFGV